MSAATVPDPPRRCCATDPRRAAGSAPRRARRRGASCWAPPSWAWRSGCSSASLRTPAPGTSAASVSAPQAPDPRPPGYPVRPAAVRPPCGSPPEPVAAAARATGCRHVEDARRGDRGRAVAVRDPQDVRRNRLSGRDRVDRPRGRKRRDEEDRGPRRHRVRVRQRDQDDHRRARAHAGPGWGAVPRRLDPGVAATTRTGHPRVDARTPPGDHRADAPRPDERLYITSNLPLDAPTAGGEDAHVDAGPGPGRVHEEAALRRGRRLVLREHELPAPRPHRRRAGGAPIATQLRTRLLDPLGLSSLYLRWQRHRAAPSLAATPSLRSRAPRSRSHGRTPRRSCLSPRSPPRPDRRQWQGRRATSRGGGSRSTAAPCCAPTCWPRCSRSTARRRPAQPPTTAWAWAAGSSAHG